MLKRHLQKRTGLNQFAAIFLGVFFYPVDGDTFLVDVGWLIHGCTGVAPQLQSQSQRYCSEGVGVWSFVNTGRPNFFVHWRAGLFTSSVYCFRILINVTENRSFGLETNCALTATRPSLPADAVPDNVACSRTEIYISCNVSSISLYAFVAYFLVADWHFYFWVDVYRTMFFVKWVVGLVSWSVSSKGIWNNIKKK
jgi:hypothetical protein